MQSFAKPFLRFLERRARVTRRALLLLAVGVFLAPGWASAGRDMSQVDEALAKDDLATARQLLEQMLAAQPDDPQVHGLLGEIRWRRGELKESREHFDKALAKNPADAHALAGKALVALAQDDLPGAEQLATKALEADKKEWLANFAMGRVILAQGKVEAAFSYLEKGKDTKKRGDGRDLFEEGMGLLALAEKDVEGAETNLIRARALAPNTVEHVMALAAMYESTQQWGQAAKVLEDMGAKIGKTPQLSYRLGRAYENMNRLNEAAKEYQSTLQADSTYAPALASLGHLFLLDTKRTPAAINLLSRAVALRPTAATRLDLGIALTRDNRAAEAIPHLEAVLAENPEPAVKLALARAYLKSDNAAKGLEMFKANPELANEAQASDMVLVGTAWIQAKDYPKARAALDKAEEKDATLSDIPYRRGLILLYEKNYPAAIEQLQKKILADPQSANAWLNLAIAYQGNRDPKAAAEAYRKVTELAPNSLQAWTSYANVLSEQGANDQAKAAFDKALQIDAKNAPALRGRGYLYLAASQYPQAITDLRGATASDPKDPQGWVWLGQALLNSGNKPDAEAAFQKVLQLEPGNAAAKEGLDVIKGNSR